MDSILPEGTLKKNSYLDISSATLTAIEHPGIAKNIDKILESLGGQTKITHSLKHSLPLKFYLKPQDAFCKPVQSGLVQTSNLVLQLTVPKMTGRKRKRGSDDPFTYHDEDHDADALPARSIKALRRCLCDNATSYRMLIAGAIDETHRFRRLPDFQYHVHDPLTQSIKQSIWSLRYEDIKPFQLDTLSKGRDSSTEILPPPTLSKRHVPAISPYHKTAKGKQVDVADKTETTANRQRSGPDSVVQAYMRIDMNNNDKIPTRPAHDLPPESSLPSPAYAALELLRQSIEKRPICSLTYMMHHSNSDWLFKILPYVVYQLSNGPWADMYVKFGIDPRSDPKWRMYQSVHFQGNRVHDPQNKPTLPYVFDGRSIEPTTRIYQMCDVQDPQLRPLVESEPRPSCNLNQFGWFKTIPMVKLRFIMRKKKYKLLLGEPVVEENYIPVLEAPEDGTAVAPSGETQAEVMDEPSKEARTMLVAYRWELNSGTESHTNEAMGANVTIRDPSAEFEQADSTLWERGLGGMSERVRSPAESSDIQHMAIGEDTPDTEHEEGLVAASMDGDSTALDF